MTLIYHTHTHTHIHIHTHTHSHTGVDDNCMDCTPDELAALVREIRDSSGLIGSHTYHLVNYKNTFVGRELVDWLIKTKGYKSKYNIKNVYGWLIAYDYG